jgi:hypothetical protein
MSGRPIHRISNLVIFLSLLLLATDTVVSQSITVTDIGLETGFQDTVFGHHKRGRACIGADFDLDGYIDFFIGNPGDESFILRNVPGPSGGRFFELHQVLTADTVSWGGVAFDYDNDGDYDLFVSVGANEGIGLDHLFRNDWILDGIETGVLNFTDVTEEAGVAGPVPNGGSEPVPTASANAVVADYDQDGDGDIFVSGNIHWASLPQYPELIGRNTLWRNNGDGTFTDVTVESGLSVSLAPTRHSTFVDFDNDGDADLYENNFTARNVLWQNNGDGTFSDVTIEMSAPGYDLGEPEMSFASGAADFNNDGWEDIISFMRGPFQTANGDPMGHDCSSSPPFPTRVLDEHVSGGSSRGIQGHALYINGGGAGYQDVAPQTIINNLYVMEEGVMGCMVGDVNNDGAPDIYVGNGGPPFGVSDQFYVSAPVSFGDVVFEDMTSLIDFAPEIPDGFPEPPYPYRTHGTAFVDIDNDGQLEIAVVNGGPSVSPDIKREPNRLFRLNVSSPSATFRVRPIGNGETVSRDAIGTRIALRVSREGSAPWTVHRTLFAGSCFSAQNGFQLHFGLADADSIEQMDIIWPDGTTSTISGGLTVNGTAEVRLDSLGNTIVTGVGTEPEPYGLVREFSLAQNFPNPFNPSTTIRYTTAGAHVRIEVFDVLGKRVTTLVDENQEAGTWSATWDGRDDAGRVVASGLYVYRLTAGSQILSRKMLLTR